MKLDVHGSSLRPRQLGWCLLLLFTTAFLQSAQGAVLSGSLARLPAGAAVNLSAEGTLDWAHWGLASPSDFNRKSNVMSFISNFTVIGIAPVEQANASGLACSWTNGMPTPAATDSLNAVFVRGSSNGFELTVAASPATRRLRVYAGVAVAQGTFEASLSDASSPPYVDASLNRSDDATNGVYTLDFSAASTGQTLLVRFTVATEYDPAFSSVLLQAATLEQLPTNQPPLVTLTNPTNDANFTQGDAITLDATASDSDGVISLVEFFDGAVKIGQAAVGTSSFIWTNATPGAHSVKAVATDDDGARSTSSAVTIHVNSGLGLLSASVATPPASIQLTVEGTSDWAHWGAESEFSFDHKAGVASQISNYTLLGAEPAYAYFDNAENYTWTDGTPTPSAFSTPSGVYVAGRSNGFEVTVSADTTVKTLKLYVGAYGAVGQLQGFLSDNSSPMYFDRSLVNPGNGPSAVYTINFRAATPGQTLLLRYTVDTMLDVSYGNVTLQAATLVGSDIPPTATLASPTNHAAFLAPATVPLHVEASDADGSVTNVEFFVGAVKLGERTTRPYDFTWSSVPAGNYVLTARATDNLGATFTTAPVQVHVINGGGVLSGSFAAPPSSVNLSAEGRIDWAHWGLQTRSSYIHKSGGTFLSNVSIVGSGTRQRYTDNFTGFTWTNGTPTQSANQTTTGIYVSGLNRGFQLIVPADATLRQLRLYVGLYGSRGRLQASLSGFSAVPFTDDSLVSPSGNASRVYTLDYAAATAGQTLTITWTASAIFDQTFGNVTWQAATLQSLQTLDLKLRNPRWSNGNFIFSVMSGVGTSYTAEFSESLLPGTWQPLTNFIGTGGEMHITNLSPASSHRSYRLRLP